MFVTYVRVISRRVECSNARTAALTPQPFHTAIGRFPTQFKRRQMRRSVFRSVLFGGWGRRCVLRFSKWSLRRCCRLMLRRRTNECHRCRKCRHRRCHNHHLHHTSERPRNRYSVSIVALGCVKCKRSNGRIRIRANECDTE